MNIKDKIAAIYAAGVSFIDCDYLNLLVDTFNTGNEQQKQSAVDKIDNWYKELVA
jgi:hypothetical protein